MPEFFSALAAIGGKVDKENRRVNGVAVLERGAVEGRKEAVDDTTMQQVVQLGNAGGIRARLNHPNNADAYRIDSDLATLLGSLSNFRIDGDVVRADLQLLSSNAAPLADRFLSLAEEAPDLFGASMVFNKFKTKKPGDPVRVQKLFSVDFVDLPAANSRGLFSATKGKPMSLDLIPRDGKFFVKIGDDEHEVTGVPAPTPAPAQPTPPAAPSSDMLSAKVAEEREKAIAEEREYSKQFRTALSTAGITGKAAEDFERDFYGRKIEDVKFLASHAIGQRTKPAGEGGADAGTPRETDEQKAEKEVEMFAAKRFAEDGEFRAAFGVAHEPANSPKYKAALDRYVAQEKRFAARSK